MVGSSPRKFVEKSQILIEATEKVGKASLTSEVRSLLGKSTEIINNNGEKLSYSEGQIDKTFPDQGKSNDKTTQIQPSSPKEPGTISKFFGLRGKSKEETKLHKERPNGNLRVNDSKTVMNEYNPVPAFQKNR